MSVMCVHVDIGGRMKSFLYSQLLFTPNKHLMSLFPASVRINDVIHKGTD